MPADLRQNFLSVTWRVAVGSLALALCIIPYLKICVYVAGRYSLRRTVTSKNGEPAPIIEFRTQQSPILHTLAQAFVFEAYAEEAVQCFTNTNLDVRVRHGIAASAKAVMVHHCQRSLYDLTERCGAQGLFEYNQIIAAQV